MMASGVFLLGVKMGLRCEHVHLLRKGNAVGGKVCLFKAHLPFMVLPVSLGLAIQGVGRAWCFLMVCENLAAS